MTIPTNLFADLPQHLPDELFTTLLDAANVRIERIVSHGHASPDGLWCDQGDFVNIPAHKKRRVEWTTPDEPTISLAVHFGHHG